MKYVLDWKAFMLAVSRCTYILTIVWLAKDKELKPTVYRTGMRPINARFQFDVSTIMLKLIPLNIICAL